MALSFVFHTYAKALLHGIRVKPIMNSSVVGDGIQYHKNVNIGIAVALD